MDFKKSLNLHPGLQLLHLPAGDVWIQRDDLIHPIISGNKWRKLQGYLRQMLEDKKTVLVTFGGFYSNHLLATAVAAQLAGIRSIGILRGDEPIDNHYLAVARAAGMELVGVSRSLYRNKSASLINVLFRLGYESVATEMANLMSDESNDQLNQVADILQKKHPEILLVNEGGKGSLGLEGFLELAKDWGYLGVNFSHVFHASATGTTAFGMYLALQKMKINARLMSVLVLNNIVEQRKFVEPYLYNDDSNWQWITGFEFGGYAKSNAKLDAFVKWMINRNQIPFEPIYTGKALFAMNDWLESVKNGQADAPNLIVESIHGREVYNIVFIHTGGTLNTWNHSGSTLPVMAKL